MTFYDCDVKLIRRLLPAKGFTGAIISAMAGRWPAATLPGQPRAILIDRYR